jgi:hypothetical protein
MMLDELYNELKQYESSSDINKTKHGWKIMNIFNEGFDDNYTEELEGTGFIHGVKSYFTIAYTRGRYILHVDGDNTTCDTIDDVIISLEHMFPTTINDE